MERPTLRQALERAAAGGAAIALMIALADATGYPLMGLPFTTSIVMVLGSPEVPAARPARVLGGHVACAAIAITCTMLLGFDAWVAALAIAISILVMLRLDIFHPPAGITPMIVMTTKAGPLFLLVPVLAGALILMAFAAICSRWAGNSPPGRPD